ncbi:MAG: hypothetical protein ACRBF0_18440 [Calditrichia bacterium]
MQRLSLLLATLVLMFGITTVSAQDNKNPAMEGFNAEGSDAKAIAIADEVVAAHGGRANWDNTRYVSWKFMGGRMHVWDKWTGNIRVEGKTTTVLMNLHTMKGKAWKQGEEVVQPDSLEKLMKWGEAVWINDGYWMFLPFKLKDSGVTLKYHAEGTTADGRKADVLQLTFEEVGRTPENKYLVYVDAETRLLTQWDFYTKFDDPEPRFTTPWANWQPYGKILLSADRGKYQHSNIKVFDTLPESVFTTPDAVTLP